MTTKFFLHNAASTVAGILPATGASVSAIAAGAGVTISLVNKSMDTTIDVGAQSTLAKTTLANTANQSVPIGRWLSDSLTAQTISSQLIQVDWGGFASNTNSVFDTAVVVAVWRPSTGAVVGRITDRESASTATRATSQAAAFIQDATTTSVVALEGDILVVEIWRHTTVQLMATAYTNTIAFGGSIEGSVTSEAATLLFVNDVTLVVPNPEPVRRIAFPGTPRGNAVQRSSRW